MTRYDFAGGSASGGDGVTSVNGDAGPAVVLDATDVGADASGTATTAVATHAAATDPHGDRAYTDTQVATRVPTSRTITAGTGLTGGGALSADRTLTVAYGTTSSTAARGDDSRLSDTRTPTDGSVTDAKVASGAAIALSKLATDPLARSNHTGTQTASTISDLAATVRGYYTLASLSGDATGNTSSTHSDLTGLALSIPGAGTYRFYWLIAYTMGVTTNAMSLKLKSASAPSSSALRYVLSLQTTGTTTSRATPTALDVAITSATVGNSSTEYIAEIYGRIVATGSGTLVPQYAIGSGTGGTVTPKTGSYAELLQIA